jgi:nucleoside-diphosphate-sugar epimerase
MNNLKDKKIVVTGGAGFIGSHIVDKLVSLGAKVVVIDDLSTGKIENIIHNLPQIEFINETITNTQKLVDIFEGAYGIIHQAALPSVPRSISNPLSSHEVNSTGTLSVFVAAHQAQIKKIVYASSSSVYGDTPTLPKVEDMPHNPLSPYALQKLSAELYAKIFCNLYKMEMIGLRYFNVFGPRQDPSSEYSAVIPKFITLLKAGKNPQIYGDGEHTRDFTYVSNVVDANLKALTSTNGFGEVYNIAGGQQISLNTLVVMINKLLGTSLEPGYLPTRPGDIKDSYADITKAKKVLGYESTVTFEKGLEMTVQSFLGSIER